MSTKGSELETIDATEMRGLLEAGGMSWPEPVGEDGLSDPSALPKYNPLRDPEGAERLGKAIAERARHLDPKVIVVWEETEDAVLAHIVARELDVRAVRTWNEEGLVAHTGPLHEADRALILADAFRDVVPLRAIKAFVEQQGGEVVGVAALVETQAAAAAGAALVALRRLTGEDGDG
jgi:hypothetical protein